MNDIQLTPGDAIHHLEPATWARVNRALIVKAIAELAHELVLEPRLAQRDGDWGCYALASDDAHVEYTFRARILSLEHWLIEPASLHRTVRGRPAALDALAFVIELRTRLGLSEQVLPGYLEELARTLYANAYKLAHADLSAEALTTASFQDVERSMIAGHPIFLANHGRVGFTVEDYRDYAPEAAQPLKLVWLAALRERIDFACVSDTSYAQLIEQELGAREVARFETELRAAGLEPARYVFIPVHPWQWRNRIAQLYAADIAHGDLVYLGESADLYRPQQSIRTLFNVTRPDRHYVKTALSILNMGFVRGLSATAAQRLASGVDWVSRLVDGDSYLRRTGFGLLREVAFIGFRHHYYERASDLRVDPHKDTLAACWRESPCPRAEPGQRLITMAALLHTDRSGASALVALIRASGVSIDDWLRQYLRCYLTPLVHCFYAYNLVFTPHGENVILVLANNLPVRAIMKDIAEDIGVLNPERELPPGARHLTLRVPDEVMTLSIFIDSFDGVFRFLAQILFEHAQYPEARFWRAVAECIHDYERDQPQLAERFRRYDLFAPSFTRSCLNRLQLKNNRQMVDLNAPEPVDSLQFAGVLENPIARFLNRAAQPRVTENSHVER